jgi:hypothetical protein
MRHRSRGCAAAVARTPMVLGRAVKQRRHDKASKRPSGPGDNDVHEGAPKQDNQDVHGQGTAAGLLTGSSDPAPGDLRAGLAGARPGAAVTDLIPATSAAPQPAAQPEGHSRPAELPAQHRPAGPTISASGSRQRRPAEKSRAELASAS